MSSREAAHRQQLLDGNELDVNEAARVAGRSAETIRRWVWSGKLAASRRGRKLMILRDDLDAILTEQGSGHALTLAGWAEAASAALGAAPRAHRSAADLVLADRRSRSRD